ncbi:MAG: helix-turn-helix transcriptional regulator, partial [Deltaproteobacteria bacterium]|nr:helix-turn-helix transcriptional regulator [Deltaproteobacteria bacterium]
MPRKKAPATVPVGKKIKKARMQKKVSFSTLANETGFSVDYIKDIEAGKETP